MNHPLLDRSQVRTVELDYAARRDARLTWGAVLLLGDLEQSDHDLAVLRKSVGRLSDEVGRSPQTARTYLRLLHSLEYIVRIPGKRLPGRPRYSTNRYILRNPAPPSIARPTVVVPARVMALRGLTQPEKAVYGAVFSWTHVRVSQQYIARELGMSREFVCRTIKKLERLGFLRVVRHGRYAASYILLAHYCFTGDRKQRFRMRRRPYRVVPIPNDVRFPQQYQNTG